MSQRDLDNAKALRLAALDTVDAISAAADLASLYSLLDTQFQSFGFAHFIIAGIPLPFQRLDRAVLVERWPADWFQFYLREDFIRVDPTVRTAQTTLMPFRWSDAPIDPRDRRAGDVMNFARDFGLLEGFFLPIHGVDGSTACLSLGGRRPMLDALTMPALHLIAMYAFEHARQLYGPLRLHLDNPLTPREREVLLWSANGKSYGDIADILKITERTATAHGVSAATKLGASNKTHAVVKAMQGHLIHV